MADLDAAGAREGDVLAPPRRVEAADEARELAQVCSVNALGAAEREVERVRDEGEVLAQEVQLASFSGAASR